MSVIERIRGAWWAINGITEPHPIGVEHIKTASGSCHSGRHRACAVDIIRLLPKPGKIGCSCPCHRPALARLDGETDGHANEREPLARGDRLVSNPCDVTLTEVTDSALARGWCLTCRTDHVIDRVMFDAGRGPWRRLDGEDTG